MRISVLPPGHSSRVQLHVRDGEDPWRITAPGQREEALLDPSPGRPAFLAGGYPDWLRDLCDAVDADRLLAEAIVAEVRRRR